MRRRDERGAALIWAVATVTLVFLAVSVVAGALASQANAVRRMKAEAARADLERAAVLWVADRMRRGGLDGPETLELAGGRVVLRPGLGWRAEYVVQVHGEAPGAPVPLRN